MINYDKCEIMQNSRKHETRKIFSEGFYDFYVIKSNQSQFDIDIMLCTIYGLAKGSQLLAHTSISFKAYCSYESMH